MASKTASQFLARQDIEKRIRKRLKSLNEHIMIADPSDAFELTLRVSELQRVLYLFQDFNDEKGD